MSVATACANIALVKYWGKRDAGLNTPAAGSLSLTLDSLRTFTQVELTDAEEDTLSLGGKPVTGRPVARITAFADLVRAMAGRKERVAVRSQNSFPTAAGLASSASAFAALAVATADAFGVALSPKELSILARRGSGSAARSIFGGFVLMHGGSASDGQDAFAEPLEGIPLTFSAAVAAARAEEKKIGSTDGMDLTRDTSPYYAAWIDCVNRDLGTAQAALREGDISRLAEIVEGNCLAMHANAMAARPGIIYFGPSTLWAIQEVRAMRAEGTPVFFTIDAGPHVVAFTPPEHLEQVAARLEGHPEVAEVITSPVGDGAHLVERMP
ncbi:MAG: diphosphomevalonate decarboxylase [Myxococcales bacterium]|nr:diphosphomevalonate decarboxylase [Myxococcales bacterium]MCB9652013.1 diphosphomevalonate decarboxylase [Deltaproteobacteria bacterium]